MHTTRFSPVHNETLEAEATTRKLSNAIKRRRNQSKPTPDEYGINAYNIARSLKNLQTALAALADEYSTLPAELANITPDGLSAAVAHIEEAIKALPLQAPSRSDA